MERARILIVDDHPLVREGLAARISAQPDLEVCGEAADVEGALRSIETTHPALVIVDIALTNSHGLELIKKLHAISARTRMLVVSAYEESLFAERALRAGAHGYINKQELQEKVLSAIRAVLGGSLYLSERMTRSLIDQAIAGKTSVGKQPRPATETLSDRELQIFQLIGRGRSSREIAQQLKLSIHTVGSHREHICAKLGLRNGTELIQRATRWQIENG